MIDSVSSEGESQAWETATAADLKRTTRLRQPKKDTGIDRLPPHSPEAEQSVLGTLLEFPKESITEVVWLFGDVGGEVFFDLRHYTIFNTIVQLHDKGEPVGVISVMQRLKDNQMLEQIGGIAYLSSLPDLAISAAGVEYFADIVFEKFLLRKMLHVCTSAACRIYEHEGEANEILEAFERDALSIRASQNTKSLNSMKDNVKQAMAQIEDYANKPMGCVGLTTGFADLDKMTSGLMPGEVSIIAARPSMGKTSLAMNIAEFVALELKLPVGIFSLETTAEILTTRMICSRARVNLRNVKDGFLAERDFPKLTGVAGKLSIAPIWIDDESSLPINKLRAKARRMVQQYGIKLFVIDYLQLCQAFIGKRRIENRQQEIAEISGGIKAMAKELGVPVIALAQVDRTLDKGERKPVMADIRESGAIEQDADFIGLLHRPKRDDKKDDIDFDAVPVKLIVAKQKNGPTGEVDLIFLKSFTRFENAAKISEEDQETMI